MFPCLSLRISLLICVFFLVLPALGTFVIYSRRGEEVTPDIAREILEPYGELSKCEMLSVQMQEAMSLPSAVLVEFAKFDPKRDLNMVSIARPPRATPDQDIDPLMSSNRLFVSMTATALTHLMSKRGP